MKNRRMISLLCAIAMSLTLVLPVSAANVSDNAQLSEFAGQFVVCQVFSEAEGGFSSRLVTVYVPAGTTPSEKSALLFDAAYGSQTRSARAVDIISTKRDVTIARTSTNIGGGTVTENYSEIYASFDIDALGGTTTISVHCRNNTTGNQSGWKDLNVDTTAQWVSFPVGEVAVSNGNNITVNAKTNIGTAHSTICMVQGVRG